MARRAERVGLLRTTYGVLSVAERRLAVALLGAVVAVTADVLAQGPLVSVDRAVQRWDGEREMPALRVVAWRPRRSPAG